MAEARSGRVFIITDEQLKQLVGSIKAIVHEEISNNKNSLEDLGCTCTKDKAAEKLSVSRCTIYAMIRDGRLRATSDGRRVVVSSIHDYLEMQKQNQEKRSKKGKKSYV